MVSKASLYPVALRQQFKERTVACSYSKTFLQQIQPYKFCNQPDTCLKTHKVSTPSTPSRESEMSSNGDS